MWITLGLWNKYDRDGHYSRFAARILANPCEIWRHVAMLCYRSCNNLIRHWRAIAEGGPGALAPLLQKKFSKIDPFTPLILRIFCIFLTLFNIIIPQIFQPSFARHNFISQLDFLFMHIQNFNLIRHWRAVAKGGPGALAPLLRKKFSKIDPFTPLILRIFCIFLTLFNIIIPQIFQPSFARHNFISQLDFVHAYPKLLLGASRVQNWLTLFVHTGKY